MPSPRPRLVIKQLSLLVVRGLHDPVTMEAEQQLEAASLGGEERGNDVPYATQLTWIMITFHSSSRR